MERLNITDWAKRLDPDGMGADVIEMLHEDSPLLRDMPFIRGNLLTGHQTTAWVRLPQVYGRRINRGTPHSKGITEQITETASILEGRSQVDEEFVRLNGDNLAVRAQEDNVFLEAMRQEHESDVFYGNPGIDATRMRGLSNRADFNTLSSDQVLDGGGDDTDLASMWIIRWNPQGVTGFFPKELSLRGYSVYGPGLCMKDNGEQVLEDENGNRYNGYESVYKLYTGLAVRDKRDCVRVANVDISALTTDASAGANLIDLGVRGIHRLMRGKRHLRGAVIYCSETVFEYLDLQRMNKSNVWLALREFAGEPVLTLRGVPVKPLTGLLETESTIS